MLRWAFLLILILALIGYAVITITLRGGFTHALFAGGLAGYVGLPLTIAGAVGWFLGSRMRNWGKLVDPSRLLCFGGTLAVGALLTLIPGRAIAKSDVVKSKAYGEKVVVALEEYHSVHGTYPAKLQFLAIPEKPPHWWEYTATYAADSTHFSMRFKDNLSFSAEWVRWQNKDWVLEEH